MEGSRIRAVESDWLSRSAPPLPRVIPRSLSTGRRKRSDRSVTGEILWPVPDCGEASGMFERKACALEIRRGWEADRFSCRFRCRPLGRPSAATGNTLAWTCRSGGGLLGAREPSAGHSGSAAQDSQHRAAARLGDLGTDPTDLLRSFPGLAATAASSAAWTGTSGVDSGGMWGVRTAIGAPRIASSRPMGIGDCRMCPPGGGICPPPCRPFPTRPRRRRCC